MRTTVELDDKLLNEAMRHCRARTPQAVVEEALRTFVDVKSAERRRSSYKNRLTSIHDRISDIRLSRSATEILREDRERS